MDLATLNRTIEERGIDPTCPWTQKDQGNPESVLVAFGQKRTSGRMYTLVYNPTQKCITLFRRKGTINLDHSMDFATLNRAVHESGMDPTCPWTYKDPGNPDSVLVAFGQKRISKRMYTLVYNPTWKRIMLFRRKRTVYLGGESA